MMDTLDLEHLRGWIGRTEEVSDTVLPSLVARFEATFSGTLPSSDAIPAGLHWCIAPPAVATHELGKDGHTRRGGFLPPVPLPRRMWAGGEVEFLAPIHSGDLVTRRSRIADVAAKSGRNGDLVFVAVEHEHATPRGVAIRERQDIVYREAASARAPAAGIPAEIAVPDRSERIACSSVLLFRYSALTFNSHRIHYDLAYATEVEFYDGLVVHGPMQATLLMNFAACLRPDGRLSKISYRGVSPLIQGDEFTVNAVMADDSISAWTANGAGQSTMKMTVCFV